MGTAMTRTTDFKVFPWPVLAGCRRTPRGFGEDGGREAFATLYKGHEIYIPYEVTSIFMVAREICRQVIYVLEDIRPENMMAVQLNGGTIRLYIVFGDHNIPILVKKNPEEE